MFNYLTEVDANVDFWVTICDIEMGENEIEVTSFSVSKINTKSQLFFTSII